MWGYLLGNHGKWKLAAAQTRMTVPEACVEVTWLLEKDFRQPHTQSDGDPVARAVAPLPQRPGTQHTAKAFFP